MRPLTIAMLLAVAVIAAAGCGTDSDDDRARASSENRGPSPALAEVPDVTGETAEAGRSALEAAGFEPTFDPSPDDPSLCTVSDQDQTGAIEEGSEVILTLECKVDVPDLSGKPADDAIAELDDLGLTTTYEEEPDDPSACTIEDQDVVGEAEPDSEVVLSVICKLPDVTGKDLPTAVSRLELIGYRANHRAAGDPSACTVTSHKSEAEPGATIALTVHCNPSAVRPNGTGQAPPGAVRPPIR